jgi:hypothetical protein
MTKNAERPVEMPAFFCEKPTPHACFFLDLQGFWVAAGLSTRIVRSA